MSTRANRRLIRNGVSPIPVKPVPSFRLKPTKKKTTRGAFGNPRKRAAFIAASAQQGNELSKQEKLKRSYAAFFATTEGKEFTKEFGKSFQDSSPRPAGGGNSDPEFHDPSDLPECSVLDHPVDRIEPRDGHSEFASLDREEIELIGETFKHVFRWSLDGARSCINGDAPLVSVGKRCNVAIFRMRPDLGAGLSIEPALARAFGRGFKTDILEKTGNYYGRALEWLRRGDPLSARGERVYLLAYKVWPAEIGASTLAVLGGMNGKTRQAKDKQVNCLRDTLGGLKALTMRPDITRAKCRYSQLN